MPQVTLQHSQDEMGIPAVLLQPAEVLPRLVSTSAVFQCTWYWPAVVNTAAICDPTLDSIKIILDKCFGFCLAFICFE